MDAKPFSKDVQLARGERRYRRKVASPAQWQRILAAKGSTCRLADAMFDCERRTVEYHHLVSRAQGGDDVAPNIVPLCSLCHKGVTARLSLALKLLAERLQDDEYAYIIVKLGEGALSTLFGAYTGGSAATEIVP